MLPRRVAEDAVPALLPPPWQAEKIADWLLAFDLPRGATVWLDVARIGRLQAAP